MTFVDRTAEASRALRKHLRSVPASMAKQGAEAIVSVMRASSPAGERYWDSEILHQYQASAPGQPPAIRSGEYAKAYGSTDTVERRGDLRAAVTNDRIVGEEDFPLPLWRILEYGTRFVAPRPHVRQGAHRAAEAIRDGVARVSP